MKQAEKKEKEELRTKLQQLLDNSNMSKVGRRFKMHTRYGVILMSNQAMMSMAALMSTVLMIMAAMNMLVRFMISYVVIVLNVAMMSNMAMMS